MRDFLAVTKALADAQRLRAVLALERSPLCVCQLIELMNLAPSTVSKHMSILKQARLLECSKTGRWIYYRLAGGDAPAEVRQALRWVCRSLARSPVARADARKLREILKRDPEELCKAYGRS